jgi:hypothetical protein
MTGTQHTGTAVSTTDHQLVIPFYLYAAVAFLFATVLLFFSAGNITVHYFLPQTLAVVHIMALGWGTMITFGAAHQLVPVLTGSKLYSTRVAMATFLFSAVGIPLLAYGFHSWNTGQITRLGGLLVCVAVFLFFLNVLLTFCRAGTWNVQAVFILAAAAWLLVTVVAGFLLLLNFHYDLLSAGSLYYLSIHAHMGIVGWFLLLVMGVGSKLIPMFLVSKYTANRRLWWIFGLVNTGLVTFILGFFYFDDVIFFIVPVLLLAAAVILFGNYCYCSFRSRIRKRVDGQMRISLFSIAMMAIPLFCLAGIIVLLAVAPAAGSRLLIAYGFVIFFGWLTAIILGMTFKTLPFIVWNKIYQGLAEKTGLPSPRELFSDRLFNGMCAAYLGGFLLFTSGIFFETTLPRRGGALLLIAASVLYGMNVWRTVFHQGTHQ